MLFRQNFATTLGLIVNALCSTKRVSESNFLHVLVIIVVHLPLAKLLSLRIQVAALEEAEVELDWRGDVAVWARVDRRHAELLDC